MTTEEYIEHLKQASKRLLDTQAVWWAAFTVAQADGGAVPVDVRLDLLNAQWMGIKPGPEVREMFETLAEELSDRDWWMLICSYGEYRQSVGQRRHVDE